MRTLTYWLTLCFIFTIPFENVIVTSIGSVTRMIGALVFCAFLVTLAITKKIRLPNTYIMVFFAFWLWVAIGILWSRYPALTMNMVETYAQLLLMTVVIWNIFLTRKQIQFSLWAYLLGCYVAVFMLLRNFMSGAAFIEGLTMDRFAGGGQDPNDLGVMLAIGVVIAVWLGSTARSSPILRLLTYVYVPLGIFAILLTASRTALIALVIGVLMSFLILSKVRLSTRIIVFAVIILSAVYVVRLVPGATFERLGKLDESVSAGDFEGRGAIWQEGIEVFLEHPLAGIGAGAFPETIELRRPAHNVWIAVAAEMGLVGLALYGAMYLLVIIAALKHPKPEMYLWLGIVAMWSVGALTLNWEYRKQTWTLFALIITSASTLPMTLPTSVRAVLPHFDARTSPITPPG